LAPPSFIKIRLVVDKLTSLTSINYYHGPAETPPTVETPPTPPLYLHLPDGSRILEVWIVEYADY